MNTIYLNRAVSDDVRRDRLYDGQLFVYSARPSTRALCEVARKLTEQAFAPHDPRDAQHYMPVDEYVQILKALKPTFIHHPECKVAIRDILDDLSCDLERTYFDVPRLRTVTDGEYLTSGLGYAFKPHRDTWYSPPMCQINWWLPIYPIESENAMAFHPKYWNRPVKNDSSTFDYQDWQHTGRKTAGRHVTKDTRKQSEAREPLDLDNQLRIVTEPGGLLIFSAAHLHSTVPNTAGRTRLSIDFRTVHLADLTAERGAPNLDSTCSGTTIRDYLRGHDYAAMPEEVATMYERSPRTKVS